MHSILRAGCGAFAISLTAALMPTTPAHAADIRYTTSVTKIVVNQSYEQFSWRLTGSDSDLVEYADANLEHVGTRDLVDYDFDDSPPAAGTLRFYDYNDYGRYKVYGEVYDADFNEMTAASTYLVIKGQARSPLTIKRDGRLLTLRTRTQRYDGGYPRWINHAGALLKFQVRTGGMWKTLAWRKVPRNGVTVLRHRRAAAANYRVVVTETAKAWAATSPRVRR